MSKPRVILIDDEANSLAILEYEIKSTSPDIEIVAKITDARKAAALIDDLKPNIVFLDIEMPWLSGFEVLDQLTFLDFNLVFVTAYDQYAIKAFKYLAFDYLLKPVSSIELDNTLKRIQNKNDVQQSSELKDIIGFLKDGGSKSGRIPFPTLKGIEFYHADEIISCKADSNYTEIYTTNGKKVVISKTLKSIEGILNNDQFLRVHQSHLINLDFLIAYVKEDGGYLKMSDNRIVPLSRSRRSLFFELINKRANK